MSDKAPDNMQSVTFFPDNIHCKSIPLEMIWQPKEDITTYELAMCIPYLGRYVWPFEVDESKTWLRHFKIIDHNIK